MMERSQGYQLAALSSAVEEALPGAALIISLKHSSLMIPFSSGLGSTSSKVQVSKGISFW